MPIGLRAADARYKKRRLGPYLRLLDILADLLVFRHIRDSLGLPKARVCYTSGSMLSPDTLRFPPTKVPLKNIYGSTETELSPVRRTRSSHRAPVGTVNPGVELRVDDRGEILFVIPVSFSATTTILR